MGQLRGGDPGAMESLATKANHTSTTIGAIRAVLDRVRNDAPVFGDLAEKMAAEFEAQLLPRLRQAEGALGNVGEVLTWNAQEQRHASDSSAPSPSGAKPEYRTPSPESAHFQLAKFARPQVPVNVPAPAGGPTFTGGVPFAERIAETRKKIEDLLAAERKRLPELQRLDGKAQATGDALAGYGDRKAFSESKALVQHYESLLRPDRQLLYYDHKGDGALVELHGKIDAGTKNVAVLVPGMGTDQYSVDSTNQSAKDFVAAADGKLAVVVALLGDHPDDLAAVSPAHAVALGRPLAELSHAVAAEAGQQGADGAKLTVVGHSYGASIVGEGEKNGLRADRILDWAGAGVGHDVETPADLPNSSPGVQRYSMTAPGDPIQRTQGLQVGGWGHGLTDPDKFGGTVELCTGAYPNDPALGSKAGQPISGLSGHSDIWTKGSDSWQNAFGVMTGGEVKPAVYPPAVFIPRPEGGAYPYQPPPVCGPTIDIE